MIKGVNKAEIKKQIVTKVRDTVRRNETALYTQVLENFCDCLLYKTIEDLKQSISTWDDITLAGTKWNRLKVLTDSPITDKEDLIEMGNLCAQLYNMFEEIP